MFNADFEVGTLPEFNCHRKGLRAVSIQRYKTLHNNRTLLGRIACARCIAVIDATEFKFWSILLSSREHKYP